MVTHQTPIRVRYADTDQMGYVYYGKYAEYFEVGRVELIRSLGISYKQMEEQGIMLPVVELLVQFKLPAYYDELLTIVTCLPEVPRASLLTTYEVLKENGQLAATGKVKLAFIKKDTMKPTRAPEYMLQALERIDPNVK